MIIQDAKAQAIQERTAIVIQDAKDLIILDGEV